MNASWPKSAARAKKTVALTIAIRCFVAVLQSGVPRVISSQSRVQGPWSWGITSYRANQGGELATSGGDGSFEIPGLPPQDACVLVARKEGLVGTPSDSST